MQAGCVICQDPFDAAIGIVATKCGHIFHDMCIGQWFQQSNTCPECRRSAKNTLTKLFFNNTFDYVSDNDASVDALKERLHTKNLEILEKDAKIKKLRDSCASAETNVEKLHQKVMSLENSNSDCKREIQNLIRTASKNEKLISENNILKSELEHMNNVKTIVEGCCSDAQKILNDIECRVATESGYVRSHVHGMATYCSVLKRELACSVEEKTQLQNEITNMKRKMGILQANHAKLKRKFDQLVKKADMNSSFSQNTSCMPFGALKNDSPELSTVKYHKHCEKPVTPISFVFPETKKQKMNVVVLDKEVAKISSQEPSTPVLRLANSAASARSIDEDSVSRVGYNGLGGHGRVVKPSGVKILESKKPRSGLRKKAI